MLINTVFLWNDQTYRMIYCRGNEAWLYRMNSNRTYCDGFELNDLRKAEKEGKITEIQDPYEDLRFREAHPAEIAKGERNFALIKPLIDNPAILFDKKAYKEKVKTLCESMEGDSDFRSKERKITRCLMQWWERGQVPAVMIPNYAPKTAVREYTKKPGRKNSTNPDGPPLNKEIRDAFDKTCREQMLLQVPASVTQAYSIFLADWEKTHGVAKEKAPTEYQFRYFYQRNYPTAYRASTQHTKIEKNKDIRPLFGNTYDIARQPGSTYEIDSTTDNIQLLSNDRKNPIGRPTLYVVTDVYSGMITGFGLSLEPAQFKTAADALYMSMTNKVEFCSKYGISIPSSLWPAEGIPASITADNGELTGDQIEHLNRAFGVQVNFTSSYRADEKGTVESAIHQLQRSVRYLLRGRGLVIKEEGLLAKAGDKDSRGDAVLTLDDYTKIMIRAVLLANRRVRRNTPPGFPDNVGSTPLNIWANSFSKGDYSLRRAIDKDILRLTLLPHYKGTFSRDGANVLGIRYVCTHEEFVGYFVRHDDADRPKGWKIALDPADVAKAWLQPDQEKRPKVYWPCTLAPTSAHLSGMTLRRALEYIKKSRQANREARMEYVQFAGKMNEEQVKDVQQAEGRKPGDNRSTRQKVANIKENRAAEIDRQEASSPRMTTPTETTIQAENRTEAEDSCTKERCSQSAEVTWDYHLTDDIDINDLGD